MVLPILNRCIAGIFGGYAATVLISLAYIDASGQPRAEAVLSTLLLSFAVYSAAIIWAFSARTGLHVWLGLVAAVAVVATIANAFKWVLGA